VREFRDRRDAGERLAARLAAYADESPVVVGLPRGGVVVAAAVAEALQAPLDVIVVRKLGVPSQPELGMGAVGEGGVIVRTQPVIDAARVTPEQFDAVVAREQDEVARHVSFRLRGRSHLWQLFRTCVRRYRAADVHQDDVPVMTFTSIVLMRRQPGDAGEAL